VRTLWRKQVAIYMVTEDKFLLLAESRLLSDIQYGRQLPLKIHRSYGASIPTFICFFARTLTMFHSIIALLVIQLIFRYGMITVRSVARTICTLHTEYLNVLLPFSIIKFFIKEN
jgi:hypothetical protein